MTARTRSRPDTPVVHRRPAATAVVGLEFIRDSLPTVDAVFADQLWHPSGDGRALFHGRWDGHEEVGEPAQGADLDVGVQPPEALQVQ